MAREVPELPPGYVMAQGPGASFFIKGPTGRRLLGSLSVLNDSAWAHYGRARFAADEERDALAEEVLAWRRNWDSSDHSVHGLRQRNEARGWPSARGEGRPDGTS